MTELASGIDYVFNNPGCLACVTILGVVLANALLFAVVASTAPNVAAKWQLAAAKLSLQFDQVHGTARLRGTYREHAVEIRAIHKSWGNRIKRITQAEVPVQTPNQVWIKVRPKEMLRMGPPVGREPTQTGDPTFDRKLTIASIPPELIVDILNDEVLRATIAHLPALHHLDMVNGMLSCEHQGLITDTNSLHELLDALCNIAEAIELTAPSL